MAVKTADFERRCVSPVGLQDAIDALVASRRHGRSFVRYIVLQDRALKCIEFFTFVFSFSDTDHLAQKMLCEFMLKQKHKYVTRDGKKIIL